MRVRIERDTATHVIVTVTEYGKTTFQQRGNFNANAYQNRVLAKIGIDLDTFLRAIPAEPGDPPAELAIGEDDTETPFFIAVRDLRAPAEYAETFTANDPAELLSQVLTERGAGRTEPVLTWPGTDRLAVVDVDYHSYPLDDRPTPRELDDFARKVSPVPVAWHSSHGRGLKLFYAAAAGFSAKELAAVACLSYRSIDARATLEIKRESRHPGYPRDGLNCGEVHFTPGNVDLSAVARWLGGEVSDDDINAYLAAKGWERDRHYEHSHCPLRPYLPSHGEPVIPRDFGVYCHKCSNEGIIGSSRRSPGFVSYASLLGANNSQIAGMLKNFVHWPHARNVLDYVLGGLPEPIAESAYRAALKMLHGDDPRIEKVFTAADIVLVGENWLASANRTTLRENVGQGQVKSLPACMYVEGRNGNAKLKVDETRLSVLRHPGLDRRSYGYYSLHPIYGAKIWGEFLPYADGKIPFLIPNPRISPGRQPTYIPVSRRGDVEAAWQLFESACPGLNRNYVKLLLCAKGCAQGDSGPMPLIIVAGVSGAGKTGHVDIAASISGDVTDSVTYRRDRERFFQQIYKASRGGDYIKFDEVFKHAKTDKMTAQDALDPLLNFSGESLGHVLYVGPQSIGRKLPIIITDIDAPVAVAQDIQLARRFVYVRLPRRVEWVPSCQAYRIPGLLQFRDVPEFADAADVILSDVIDTFFRSPITFFECAEKLGFTTLEKSSEHPDADPFAFAFAQAVFAAPPLTGTHALRRPEPGLKLIMRDYAPGDTLSELYAEFADDQFDGWGDSRRLRSIDWSKVLGVLSPVRLDLLKARSTMLYVRFATGGDFKAAEAVNEGIK